ncbi:hypothetical protein FOA52_009042 [Chlamydomonas sp. UWO 241]|nr:hypothetical protein FOA52_009042 [Chlamydomonas sp. UWO 241]
MTEQQEAQQEEAARALGNLAAGDHQTKFAIASAGAIPALVEMMESTPYSSVRIRIHAEEYGASTLSNLAEGHAQNQTAICIAAGAIPVLVQMLDWGLLCAGGNKAAERALDNLAHNHPQNQAAIAAAKERDEAIEFLRLEEAQRESYGASPWD